MASRGSSHHIYIAYLERLVFIFYDVGGFNLCPQDTKNDPIFKRKTDLESNTVVESDILTKKISPNILILF